MDEKHEKSSESIDGNPEGYTNTDNIRQDVDEVDALQVVSADSPDYNMSQDKRGYAIIFKQQKYNRNGPKERNCASYDANECSKTFKTLGFEVHEYSDLTKQEFLNTLDDISEWQHENCDSLAVIFMSHGTYENKEEYIWLKDDKVPTSKLWNCFTPDKCMQLAGKPKMFFIQACRGVEAEKVINLKTDSVDSVKQEDDYTIPFHSDMLIMWASYPEMVSFRRKTDEKYTIKGSVFLHFLCQVLARDYAMEDLYSMLLTVTRNVAIQYTSEIDDKRLDNKKQMPYTVSTLMRKVFFGKNQDAVNNV
ncbi:unnamed protein product [Meganyctiphanes norvegica]|uniref:Caspase-1 n=1 Tax=Meganyctiphanes norvegica TaxID=48144 RepID=A0AAV2RDH9_MEGNR